jgi:hypothetical protein
LFTDDKLDQIHSLAYRYDQIEMRDNMSFLKKNLGVDVALEITQAFKNLDYTIQVNNGKIPETLSGLFDQFKVTRYNPLKNGHYFLLDLETKKDGVITDYLILLLGKNSYLSN